ncbi:MAG: PqqD family protein [Clostridia bacterium]|nr:PqqD family protein [Clostridia bacterium]
MKIKDGFVLREVAGSYLVVAVGEAAKNFKGMINLNETGAFLWRLAEKGATKQEMLAELLKEYDVDENTAANDIDVFMQKLIEAELVK